MAMTDDELQYWLDRGSSIAGDTLLIEGTSFGELKQVWKTIAEVGTRILEIEKKLEALDEPGT